MTSKWTSDSFSEIPQVNRFFLRLRMYTPMYRQICSYGSPYNCLGFVTFSFLAFLCCSIVLVVFVITSQVN
jgi:hypothetical protein